LWVFETPQIFEKDRYDKEVEEYGNSYGGKINQSKDLCYEGKLFL
jgi:hypothetical protein